MRNCKLPDELIEWLKTVVIPRPDDPRGIILLSHQQYYSAFRVTSPSPHGSCGKPALKIRPLVLGHEHRFAGYDLFGKDHLKAYGRCVGHGGMPLSLCLPTKKPQPKFYDVRKGAQGFGVNGHVNLHFQGPHLDATYVDLNGTELVKEKWSVDTSGAIHLDCYHKILQDPDFRG